jgi:hypothetical protein
MRSQHRVLALRMLEDGTNTALSVIYADAFFGST